MRPTDVWIFRSCSCTPIISVLILFRTGRCGLARMEHGPMWDRASAGGNYPGNNDHTDKSVPELLAELREARRQLEAWKRLYGNESGRADEWKDEASYWCQTAQM